MKQIHPKYITVISDYFLEFANKQWRKIEKETSLSLQEIQYLHDIVQTLNPRPGLSWSNAQTEYVVPDIIIEKRNHQWHIQIADESFFDIQVNKDYYEVLKEQTDAVVKSYLKEKYQQICWLKHALEQRKHTMLKMMRAIIEKQGDYFLNPNTPLKPMTMIEIANKIGVHESTVSRMTKNKYVKAPMGTIHLRTLFTARIHPKNSGGGFSTDAIKRQLVEIINNEDKKTPYSDQKILEILREKGINVSRRTIAKYRDLLHIPSSTKRKRYS